MSAVGLHILTGQTKVYKVNQRGIFVSYQNVVKLEVVVDEPQLVQNPQPLKLQKISI